MFEEGKKNGQGKGGKYLEKENIFFAEEKKNRKGKGGKYGNENIFFCGGKEKRKTKRRQIFGEGKNDHHMRPGW